MSKRKAQQNVIRFSCHAPDAKHVFLAGAFNDWKPNAAPMKKQKDGNWIAELDLPPGRYEFKFVVDDRWCCETGCHVDAECLESVPNSFGTMNLVCEVQ